MSASQNPNLSEKETRRLNSELFAPAATRTTERPMVESGSESPQNAEATMTVTSERVAIDFDVLDKHYVKRSEIKEIVQLIEDQQIQTQEFAKAFNFKIERLTQSVKRLEEFQTHLRQELARQYAEISGKVHERRIAESKIGDLVDRHNSVVATFEGRLNQMKKLMDEKEMRFLQTKAELEEAYRQLQKFQKMSF